MIVDRHARFRLLKRLTVWLSAASLALAGVIYLQVSGVMTAAADVLASPAPTADPGTPQAPTDPGVQPPQDVPAPGLGQPVVTTGGS